jgi:hypothetical protein
MIFFSCTESEYSGVQMVNKKSRRIIDKCCSLQHAETEKLSICSLNSHCSHDSKQGCCFEVGGAAARLINLFSLLSLRDLLADIAC